MRRQETNLFICPVSSFDPFSIFFLLFLAWHLAYAILSAFDFFL